jgi:ABC-type branched-subunit amino acid transport system substrate-binding protein
MGELDFELEVRSTGVRDYEVAVLRSPAGEARTHMHFPFEDLELQVRLLALENALLRSGGTRRQIASPEEQTVSQFGRELFDALIDGDVRSRFDASLAEANRRREPLRIKLRFDTPTLSALPWEFLFDRRGRDYLVLSTSTPLVRYIEVAESIKPLTVTAPLRMLGMVASPSDLPELDVNRERQRIEEATADLQKRGLLELHWLERGTYRELQQTLRRQKQSWHVFHFAGHGGFDPQADEGLVAFVDEEGGSDRVPATELGRLLGDHKPLRLAVLNACEGARGSKHDLFSSTAATLVQRGTPAVVAMQYEITDDAAKEFSRSFYEAIADNLPVDIAVTEARKSLSHEIANTLEWGTPVLFMRSMDGVLFRVRPPRAVRPAAAVPISVPPPEPVAAGAAMIPTTMAGSVLVGAGTGTAAEPPRAPGPAAAPVVELATTPLAAVAVPGPINPLLSTPAVPGIQPVGGDRIWPGLGGRGGIAVVVMLALVGGALGARFVFGVGKDNPQPSGSAVAPPQTATVGPSIEPSSSQPSPSNAGGGVMKGTLHIAFELVRADHPQSRGIVDAVDLAIKDAGGEAGGWKIDTSRSLTFYDGGKEETAARQLSTIVAKPDVVAVVGPYSSDVAAKPIQISNGAGLLQCSPTATRPDLTQPVPPFSRINFIRTVTTTNFDGPGAAKFIFEKLGKSQVYVLDNSVNTATARADQFTSHLAELGGTVIGRQSLDMKSVDLAPIVAIAKSRGADVLYFSGSMGASAFAARLLKEIRQAMPDAVFVASGEVFSDQPPFLNGAAGSLDSNVYAVFPAVGDYPGRTEFESRYRLAYGPPTLYIGSAYACAQVILDAIRRAGDTSDPAVMRERVRAAAVDPAVTYQSLIGDFHFDANGDTSQRIVTIYQVDPGGKAFVLNQAIDVAR